jgi:hypothetical protein
MDVDWKAVIVHGGPFRGFSQIMPAFGEALSDNQINTAIQYLRGFCENPHWPRAELNLPRALITEKAYPEDEVVITTSFNAQGAPGVSTDVVYEQRFGVKNQIEVTVPFCVSEPEPHVVRVEPNAGGLEADVFVENLTGHKLPTAYPSRRAWLHVRVQDGNHRTVFESGGLNPDGSIQGNDNDADPARFEPHDSKIENPDQVQITNRS